MEFATGVTNDAGHMKVPHCTCPGCDAIVDGAEYHGPESDAQLPEPGDPSICAECGFLMVFNDDLTQRTMTQEDMFKLPPGDLKMLLFWRKQIIMVREKQRANSSAVRASGS